MAEFNIVDFPRCFNELKNTRGSIALGLIRMGYKSSKWNGKKRIWYMDDLEYTHFVLRWS